MTAPTPNASDWPFIEHRRDHAGQGDHRPDGEIDATGDDDDGLGGGRQGERQDRDRQALQAGRPVARLDELGEHEQQDEEPDQAERPAIASRPSGGDISRPFAAGLDRSGRGAHGSPSGSEAGSGAASGTRGGRVGRSSCRLGDAGGDELGRDLLGHLRVRPEVVGGSEERRLIGIRRLDLGHDAAAEDDDRPIAGELDLLELGGVEQDGGPGFREVAEQDVDLLLGADVDAPRRVEAEQRPDATRDPAGDGHLLLVAAREPADLASGASLDLEPGDGRVDPASLAIEVDRAPRAHAGGRWQRDVLAHRSLHQQGLGAVGRDVHEARSDGVSGMAERDGRAVHEQLAAARAVRASQDVEQLVLPLALEGHDPEHLARIEVEGDILQLGARAQSAGGQARRHVDGAGRGCRPVGDGRHLLGDLAEHQLDDPLLGALGHVDDTDRLALAQDGRPVADGGDLDHPVGDEDHRAIAAPAAADDLEDALRQVGGQGRGHLVEHQHVGLDGQRPRQVDDPERGKRQPARHARQIEVDQSQLGEPVTERLEGRLGQPQVGSDVQVRDERRLLVDRHDPAATRFARRVDGQLSTADGDRAAVGSDGAGQDLDQRALAGAIGAHQRMDLTRRDGKGGRLAARRPRRRSWRCRRPRAGGRSR